VQEALTRSLATWRWDQVAFTTYTYKAAERDMLQEITGDKGRSQFMNSRIWALRQTRDLWKETHKKDGLADNEKLAQAMFLYYKQPDLKLKEDQTLLRQALITLGEKLKVFPEAGQRDKLTLERRIEIAMERMDLCDELEKASYEMEGDSQIEGEEDDDRTLFDSIGNTDIYHRLDLKKLKDLMEPILAKINEPYQKALRFRLVEMLDGVNHTIADLAKELGVDERNARNIYQRAIDRFYQPSMDFYKFRQYLIETMDW